MYLKFYPIGISNPVIKIAYRNLFKWAKYFKINDFVVNCNCGILELENFESFKIYVYFSLPDKAAGPLVGELFCQKIIS